MSMEVLHECTRCGERKPAQEFNRRRRAASEVRQSWCRACQSAYASEWRRRTGRVRDERQEWCQACGKPLPPYVKGQPRRYCDNSCRTRKRVCSTFGITPSGFERLLRAQAGGCAICGDAETSDGRGFHHIDHNHETGAVRGILCGRCNQGLGLFKDNPDVLRAAAEYLERSTTWHAE